jgi:hypothetical protein
LFDFQARVHFFVNLPLVKIDFAIQNPRAAKHPGGLWDLGDPASLFFKELFVQITLRDDGSPAKRELVFYDDPVPMDYQEYPKTAGQTFEVIRDYEADAENNHRFRTHFLAGAPDLAIYQDSSGGDAWQSPVHVNRYNEIPTSFRGYRIFSSQHTVRTGLRTNPTISLVNRRHRISAGIQHFWQNFPKSLSVNRRTVKLGLFPRRFGDLFELQGGEQKTHSLYLNFTAAGDSETRLEWIQSPLVARCKPQCYLQSGALPHFVSAEELSDPLCARMTSVPVHGDDTFFLRREEIDEYGWRNFGELYADHEAIGGKGREFFISHYNNQYDVLLSALKQFLASGDFRWFVLADQLAKHVRDIDIYHTDQDRAEYNHGMFWHTDHYIDARTATHRCFSSRHRSERNMAFYGGGPSLSHNYATGLLFHYYLTGDAASADAVRELGSFVEANVLMERTLSNFLLRNTRKIVSGVKQAGQAKPLVQFNKVYSLNGPGRASGNSLSVLLDAFQLSKDERYLDLSEDLIAACIHPSDDIDARDLLDVENRWMYTIFLQALGKYLDTVDEFAGHAPMTDYARQSLVRYAAWMAENERLYLQQPEKLEYPNETWASQELRKCNVFLFAAKHSPPDRKRQFHDKAGYFYRSALEQLASFPTSRLTRPVAVFLQNCMMYPSFDMEPKVNAMQTPQATLFPLPLAQSGSALGAIYRARRLIRKVLSVSLSRELQFLKWRLPFFS